MFIPGTPLADIFVLNVDKAAARRRLTIG